MATMITKFRADDGSEWPSIEMARQRESEITRINAIVAPLGSIEIHGDGYHQHKPEVVRQVWRALFDVIIERYGASYPNWRDLGADMLGPFSIVGRVVSDSIGPLAKACNRMSCFSMRTGRQYEQPYYVINEDTHNTQRTGE